MERFKQKGAAVQIRAASAQTELMDRSGVHTEEINTQTGAWTEIVKGDTEQKRLQEAVVENLKRDLDTCEALRAKFLAHNKKVPYKVSGCVAPTREEQFHVHSRLW